jgi:hypothetical protein
MLDAAFFTEAFPSLVQEECKGRPDHVPVVHLHLSDGSLLDVCHILHLAPAWISVAFYRDAGSCEDMDFAFLPYGLISRVELSFHDPQSRRLGFRIESEPQTVASSLPATGDPP